MRKQCVPGLPPEGLGTRLVHGALNGLNLVDRGMHIGFFACFHAISPERSRFSKIATFFLPLVALKLLVSLMSRLLACSARIVADKQTNRQTDRHVHTQNDFHASGPLMHSAIIRKCVRLTVAHPGGTEL